jgi:hypothetical protein
MASAQTAARPELSTDPWPGHKPLDSTLRPTELRHDAFAMRPPSLARRAFRALARFLITVGIGVGATLAWQSYGDEARQKIAESSPQLAWLAPPAAPEATIQAAPVAQSAPETVAPAATPSDLLQVKAISLGLASMQQKVDQLAAGQQQMAGDIARLQAAEQDILQKVSAPPPRPAPAPARKPMPVTTTPSSLAPPVR